MIIDNSLRLNKHLALHLGISRREADLLIEQGHVTIAGTTAQLGARFSPGDSITVKGRIVQEDTDRRYVLFHKPAGYVCSRKKQGEHDTIYAILPRELHTLKPVGRLDKDSSGLLLLTNDGDFAHQMTHPRFYKLKTYHIQLDRELEPLHQQMISDYGVALEDGVSKLGLVRLSETHRKSWIITMSEGRNRQIRRTFAALGYTVIRLHRVNFGNYSLGDMKPGTWRDITIS